MKDTQKDAYRCRAFTLVELLTVVVVIAILIGLLMPTLGTIRERSRCAKCVSNLKQLHTAAMNFATDAGELPWAASCDQYQINPDGTRTWRKAQTGWLDWISHTPGNPPAGDPRTYSGGANGLTCIRNGTLYSYVKDVRVYLCPTYEGKNVGGAATINTWIPTPRVRNYGMNYRTDHLNIYGIANASRLLLFGEQGLWINAQQEYGKYVAAGPNASVYDLRYDDWNLGLNNSGKPDGPRDYRRRFWMRDGVIDGFQSNSVPGATWSSATPCEHLGAYHDGYANCVFVDGHVEKIWHTNTVAVCDGTWGGIK